jgi:adenosylcobinamide kinase / adenosylcobinamide-phosphate guanylyltransferase
MSHIILVTGPARSGKSEWAETLAIRSSKPVIYIATATIDPKDLEWQNRIFKHQQRRSENWVTREVPINLTGTIQDYPTNCLLIDSLGTWVANLLDQDEQTWEHTLQTLLLTLQNCTTDIIFVAEETGWGVVPAYEMGRTFRDRLGTVTRKVGSMSDTVYLVTGGHVLNISQLGFPLM